jgi:hypothetical protein
VRSRFADLTHLCAWLAGRARASTPFASVCLVLATSIGSWPALAAAFCRTTTAEPSTESCPLECPTQGYPLFWPQRHIRYHLEEGGFPDLEEPELRAILERSFETWLDAVCSGRPLDLEVEQAEETISLDPRPEDSPNAIAYLSEDEWEPNPTEALAITQLRYSVRTGHIQAADILLNGGKGVFSVCRESGCEPGVIDLRNVITHEVGHFFGLAHSLDPDATMWCDSSPDGVAMRTLEYDDVAGICAIYGPHAVLGPPADGVAPADHLLCSAGPGHPAAPEWLGVGLASGLGLCLYRTRRRR